MPASSRCGWRRCRRWSRRSCPTPTIMRRRSSTRLQAAGLRVEADLRNEKINYKVREHSLAKVPLLLVVGKREAEEGTVARPPPGLRRASEGDEPRRGRRLFAAEAVPPDLRPCQLTRGCRNRFDACRHKLRQKCARIGARPFQSAREAPNSRAQRPTTLRRLRYTTAQSAPPDGAAGHDRPSLQSVHPGAQGAGDRRKWRKSGRNVYARSLRAGRRKSASTWSRSAPAPIRPSPSSSTSAATNMRPRRRPTSSASARRRRRSRRSRCVRTSTTTTIRPKMKKVFEFLEEGDKVKLTLRFRGREMAHSQLGMAVLQRVAGGHRRSRQDRAASAHGRPPDADGDFTQVTSSNHVRFEKARIAATAAAPFSCCAATCDISVASPPIFGGSCEGVRFPWRRSVD